MRKLSLVGSIVLVLAMVSLAIAAVIGPYPDGIRCEAVGPPTLIALPHSSCQSGVGQFERQILKYRRYSGGVQVGEWTENSDRFRTCLPL